MASKIWTAAELEKLTPAERHRLFESSVVTDPDDIPTELLERARARIRERGHDGPSPSIDERGIRD